MDGLSDAKGDGELVISDIAPILPRWLVLCSVMDITHMSGVCWILPGSNCQTEVRIVWWPLTSEPIIDCHKFFLGLPCAKGSGFGPS